MGMYLMCRWSIPDAYHLSACVLLLYLLVIGEIFRPNRCRVTRAVCCCLNLVVFEVFETEVCRTSLFPSCAFSVNCCVNNVRQICTCRWLHVHVLLIYRKLSFMRLLVFYHTVISAAKLNNTRIVTLHVNVDHKLNVPQLPVRQPLLLLWRAVETVPHRC